MAKKCQGSAHTTFKGTNSKFVGTAIYIYSELYNVV